MPATEIDQLQLKIESDSTGAAEEIDRLAESMKKLAKSFTKSSVNNISGAADAIKSFASAVSSIDGREISAAGEGFEALASGLKKLCAIKGVDGLADIGEQITGLSKSISDIDLSKTAELKSYAESVKMIAATCKTYSKSATAISPIMETAASVSGTGKAATALKSVESAASSLSGTISASGIIQKFKTLKDTISGIVIPTNKFSQLIKKLASKYIQNLGDSIKNATTKLSKFFKSIVRIATYRAIRTMLSALTNAFKEGFENLYEYSTLMGTTFADSMNTLATDALYLKNSLAALAAPIIDAVAPAIDYVVEKLVDMFNTINEVFAALTGASTYTVAQKVATTYGDAVDDAEDSLDELKRYTLGFDELNILGEDDSSSSSSSSDSSDSSTMFTTVEVSTDVSSLVEQIKEAIENGDWEELGTILGDKVNEIIDGIDWSGWGETIGYWLNAAIETAYYFLDTVDFYSLGQHLAELLNAALEEIDFYVLGETLVEGFTILPDIILGAIDGLNWGLIGESIGEFLKGTLDQACEWIYGYDWSVVGEGIIEGLTSAINGMDESGVAFSLFEFIGAVLGGLLDLVFGLGSGIVKALVEAIKEAWAEAKEDSLYDINGDGDLGVLETTLSFIVKIVGFEGGIGSFLKNIETALQTGFLTALTGDEGVLEFWLEITDEVEEFFRTERTLGNLLSWLTTDVGETDGIFDLFLKKTLAWLDESDTIFSQEVGLIADAALSDLSLNVWEWFSGFTQDWDINWAEVAGITGTSWGDITLAIQTAWGNITSWFSEKWEAFKRSWSTFWGNIFETVGEVWGNIVSAIQTAWGNITSWFSEKWEAFKQSWSELWNSLKEKVTTIFTNIKTSIQTVWNTIKTWLVDKVTSIKTSVTTAFTNMKTSIVSVFNTLKSKISTIWNAIWNTMKSIINKILSGVESFVNGIIKAINKLLSGINSMVNAVGDAINTLFGTDIGNINLQISTITIPRLAKGAVIPANEEFLAVLGDQSSGTNIEAPESLIRQIMQEELSGMNVSNSDSAAVVSAVSAAASSENALLKEQNSLLKQLLDKDSSVTVTTSQITSAFKRQNQRAGKTVISVGV